MGPVPNELWQMIFDHGDQKEFYKISLVCRRLHQLVEPYLYRDFNWIPDPKDPLPPILFASERGAEGKGTKNPPFILLQTIANRPELALYFKHAKLLAVSKYFGALWNKREAFRNTLASDKLLSWIQNFQNSFDGHEKEWASSFKAGRHDIVVGLLLTRAPISHLLRYECLTVQRKTTSCSKCFTQIFPKREFTSGVLSNQSPSHLTTMQSQIVPTVWISNSSRFSDFHS